MEARDYVELTQREHVLLRPDTYVSSLHPVACTVPVLLDLEGGGRLEWQEVTVAPALLKVVDELVVNAVDQALADKRMAHLQVALDPHCITICNTGSGIPVKKNEHGVHIPTMLFSHFNSGSNLVDTEKERFTGGRNGLGAKAANVFSTHFEVETLHWATQGTFRQRWENNMATASKPEVCLRGKGGAPKAQGYTTVRMHPDLARFGVDPVEGMPPPVLAALAARVLDTIPCMTARVAVTLNDRPLQVKGQAVEDFQSYCTVLSQALPTQEAADTPPLSVMLPMPVANSRQLRRVAVHISAVPRGQGRCVGFVNGIRCSQGTHVRLVEEQLASEMTAELRRKSASKSCSAVTPAMLRPHLHLVLVALVDKPEFTSQMKECLSTPIAQLRKTMALPAAFLRQVVTALPLAQQLRDWVAAEEGRSLAKAAGITATARRRQPLVVEKLDDANNAGKSGSHCTLIVTEGDSAKALAVAGVSVVGRDNYGIFPLRGKFLNVRKASAKELLGNKEVVNLMKIINLEYGRVYTDLRPLRYHRLQIFSDQDLDGHHIAGLLVNFVHHLWPSVLRICPGFIQRFATPIIRASGSGVREDFFSLAAFRTWQETDPRRASSCSIRYLKGLGSSTNLDAKGYFSNLDRHVMTLTVRDSSCDASLRLAFDEGAAEERRQWLATRDEHSGLDYAEDVVSVSDFVHRELIHYSHGSLERAIPNAVDGLKPVQRKVLWWFLQRGDHQSGKVSQLAGSIAEATQYHHGEAAMVDTIIGMAQEHVGSNNVNLLRPEGQFGTRLHKRSVHSAPRYIHTRLEPVARALFPREDLKVIPARMEEGATVEPAFLVPVLPLLLINGCNGIATGWACQIPSHDPKELVQWCREYLACHAVAAAPQEAAAAPQEAAAAPQEAAAAPQEAAAAPQEAAAAPLEAQEAKQAQRILPWFEGFRGTVESDVSNGATCMVHGLWDVDVGNSIVHVTELPPGTWTEDFIQRIHEKHMVSCGSDVKRHFVKHVEHGPADTESVVDLVLVCEPASLRQLSREQVGHVLGLSKRIRTNDMVSFDSTSHIRRFCSAEEVLEHHAEQRMLCYARRLEHQRAEVDTKLRSTICQLRFTRLIVNGEVDLRAHEEQVLEQMRHHDLPEQSIPGLLRLPLLQLTANHIARLEEQVADLQQKAELLAKMTPEQSWLEDLQNFEAVYCAFLAERERRRSNVPLAVAQAQSTKKRSRRTGPDSRAARPPSKKVKSSNK